MKVRELIAKLQKFDPEEDVAVMDTGTGRGVTYFSLKEVVTQYDFYGQRPISTYGRENGIPVQVTLFLSHGYGVGSSHNDKLFLDPKSHRYDPLYSVEYARTAVQLDPKPWVYTDPVSEKETRLKYNDKHVGLPGVEWKPRDGFVPYPESYHG